MAAAARTGQVLLPVCAYHGAERAMLSINPLGPTPKAALDQASAHAPYLARLSRQYGEVLDQAEEIGLEDCFQTILTRIRERVSGTDEADFMSSLRRAKQKAHLILSAADLCGAWPVMKITAGMTAFADCATAAALDFACRHYHCAPKGLFLIALGKMGAYELNYSSDIDIVACFDPDIFCQGEEQAARKAVKIIQHVIRLLETQTEDGYVLRTDFRLRPDPRSTKLAVSTRMAELYYERQGQNWERMVWLKARPFAGDQARAASFLADLQPFIWRHHMDYWAIEDIHAIKAMINASGDRKALDTLSPDVKLGPGGIREIEFFVQTQQLILGGRDGALRQSDTLGALDALAACGAVEKETAHALAEAYKALRGVEHRIQMRLDAQDHKVPKSEMARYDVACLTGYTDIQAFDINLRALRHQVNAHYQALFGQQARQLSAAQSGNLIFTGVDNDPGTLATLHRLGFHKPETVIETVRDWHRGHIAACRSARGREILTAFLPELLSDMGQTGRPDEAFEAFSRFMERLSSGVQTLSMLRAEADLRRDLIASLALAPSLGARLAKRPNLLEALVRRDLVTPPEMKPGIDFEACLNEARLYVRDAQFLISHDVLHGHISPEAAGTALSDIADWSVQSMAEVAAAECEAKFGPMQGDWGVFALGRYGGRAMTVTSDLDIMLIYDTQANGGPAWFTRFTQRLITALSAQTAEGALYDVDMRLRPSGNAGPAAVKLASFKTYHQTSAWTWEHMALTRLRPIITKGKIGPAVLDFTRTLLAEPREAERLRQDIGNMRQRLFKEKRKTALWDLKQGPGGLVDIEFIIQHGLLSLGTKDALTPNLQTAISKLTDARIFSAEDSLDLSEALQTLSGLQQVLRIAIGDRVYPSEASTGLKVRLAKTAGQPDFTALEAKLVELKETIARVRARRIGPLA